MNKRGHTWGAVGASLITGVIQYKLKIHTTIPEAVALYSGIYFGSFAPDIDADYSYIRSKLPMVAKAYTATQKAVANVPQLHNIFKHRGALTHSLWTLVLLAIPMLLLLSSPQVVLSGLSINGLGICGLLGCVIGCFGHHLLDMTTPAGLNYLYPVSTKKAYRR